MHAFVQAIAKQIFFRERTNLMDKDALDDAEMSLQNMLRDFVNDRQNEIPEDLRCGRDGRMSRTGRGMGLAFYSLRCCIPASVGILVFLRDQYDGALYHRRLLVPFLPGRVEERSSRRVLNMAVFGVASGFWPRGLNGLVSPS